MTGPVSRACSPTSRRRKAARTKATRADVLRRAEQRAKDMGFDVFNVGPELEYYLFKDNKSTEVLDEGGYFDLTTLDAGSTSAATRCSRSTASASTSSTRTTRSARPSTRSTCGTPAR